MSVESVNRLRSALAAALYGKSAVTDLALAAVLAGGHVLLQDVPGVGKTTLASALSRAMGGKLSRIQFTADMLPSDITGGLVLDPGGRLVFRPGPLFAGVVMADEINRATPKTQSALLEAMEEGRVTVDGEVHALPRPFVVIATQNPFDFHGTWPLPESQLDRFLVRLSIGYPDRDAERAILRREAAAPPDPVLGPGDALALLRAASAVRVADELQEAILDLVRASRQDARLLRGVSPRGAQALLRAVRAFALVQGRSFAVPEDLRAVAVPVLAHRVLPRSDGGPAGEGGARAIQGLLDERPAGW